MNKYDEYFVHQISAPLEEVSGKHHEWTERYYFDIHDSHNCMQAGIACHPNSGLMYAYAKGEYEGRLFNFNWERGLKRDRYLTQAGPISFKVLEPYKRWRIISEENEKDLVFDLEFFARSNVYQFKPLFWKKGSETVLDQAHYEQSGRYSGRVKFEGRDWQVDGCLGQRDHSWGLRKEVDLWIWIAPQFNNFAIGAWLWESAKGERVYFDGAYMFESGDIIPLSDLKHDVEFDSQNRLKSGELILRDHKGKEITLYVKGLSETPRDSISSADYLAEYRLKDEIGYGVFEIVGKSHCKYFPATKE